MLLDPIQTAVHTLEARLSSLEASNALSAGSFTSQQIATQQLCVYDSTGAQTCITKAQLDAVLASMARAAAAAPANAPPAAVTEAAVIEPSVTVIEAPAVVTEPPAIVTEGNAQDRIEPAPAETTSIVTAPAPAAMPESIPEENAKEQKPAHSNNRKESTASAVGPPQGGGPWSQMLFKKFVDMPGWRGCSGTRAAHPDASRCRNPSSTA
jgi:hypothetical protein